MFYIIIMKNENETIKKTKNDLNLLIILKKSAAQFCAALYLYIIFLFNPLFFLRFIERVADDYDGKQQLRYHSRTYRRGNTPRL